MSRRISVEAPPKDNLTSLYHTCARRGGESCRIAHVILQKDTEQINQAATPTAEPTATPTVEPTAALSENAAAVQAMVNALPGVDALEAMDAESMANAYAQTDAAYEAYLALSAEEQALITGAQVFEPLFAAFNAQMMTLEETEYSVNIPSTQGGTVTADSTSVSAGATVTLTVSPETGYGLYSLTITDASGTIASTPGEGNTYTFTMPQSDVTINATFERVFEIQLYPKTYEFGNKILTATISGTDYTLTNKDKTSCMLPSGTYTITYNDPGAQYCEKIPDITLTVKDGAIEESSAVQKNKNYGYYTIKPEITRKTYTITGVDKLGGKVHCASTKALSDASLQWTAQFVDKVFLKVTTDKGFSLKEISATDSNGNSIKITPVKDNATSELRYYTVAMPADNVTISATFEVNASEETEAEFRVVGVEGNTSLSKAAPGTNFQQWIKDNSDNPTTNCLWRVTYDGRTTVVDENTVIANGAKYTLVFELVRGDILKIYAPCNSGEIDIEYNSIRVVTDDAQLTVTHIVDGESCTAIFTEGNTTGFDVNFRDYLTICDKYNSKQVWYSSGKKISFDSTLTLNQTEYTFYYPLTTGNMGALRFAVPSTCAGKWNENGNTFNGGAKAGQVVTLNFSVKPDSVTLETASGASVTLNKVSDTVYTFTMPADAVTINAQAAGNYKISIGETTNGSVDVAQSAFAGDTVTLTVSPNAAYVLDTLTLIDASGEPINPTEVDKNTYTFTMPLSDVTIAVAFEQALRIQIYPQYSDIGDVLVKATISSNGYKQKITNKNKTSCILPSGTYTITYEDMDSKYCDAIPDGTLTVNEDGTIQESDTVQQGTDEEGRYYIIKPNITLKGHTVTGADPLGGKVYSKVGSSSAAVKRVAYEGDRVYLEIVADEGFSLNEDSISVTDSSGKPVTVELDGSNRRWFTMPASNVTITATFALTNIAPSYVITIPSTVSLNTASKMTITVSDVENMGDGEQISVQADSANGEQNSLASGKGWLVSGEQHIAYTFDAFLDFDQSGAKELELTIGDGETDGKPAGTYTDTLQFSVSLTTGE